MILFYKVLLKEKLMRYGRLEMFTGPMFSGKSAMLIERAVNDESSHIVFKTAYDTRFSDDEIVSRSGSRVKANVVYSKDEILEALQRQPDVRTVYFDEVRFFDDVRVEGFTEIIMNMLKSGIDVVVAGLDLDARGVPFDTSARMAALADSVTKLTARCHECGNVASKSALRCESTANMDRYVLGDSEKYMANCLDCFGQLRKKQDN